MSGYFEGDTEYRMSRLESLLDLYARQEASVGNPGLLSAANKSSLDLLISPQRARASRASAQSTAHATFTPISMTASSYSTPGAIGGIIPVWASGNPTRFTALRAGVYSLGAYVTWPTGAGVTRQGGLRINGVTYAALVGTAVVAGGNNTVVTLHTNWLMAAGDYMEVMAYQDTGAALNVTGDGWIQWLND